MCNCAVKKPDTLWLVQNPIRAKWPRPFLLSSQPIHPLCNASGRLAFFARNILIGRQVDAAVFGGYLQLELELRQH